MQDTVRAINKFILLLIVFFSCAQAKAQFHSTLRVRAGAARTITIGNYVSEQHKLPHSRSIMLINMKEVECDDEAPSANEGG